MAIKQEVNVPLIATIGAVSVILLIVIVIGASAWYLSVSQQITAENFEEYPDPTVTSVQGAQKAVLTAPAHWVDGQHTVAAIPIDQAMQLVVEHQGNVPVAPAEEHPAAPAAAERR